MEKIKPPMRDDFEKAYTALSKTDVAEMYGVSIATVGRWASFYNVHKIRTKEVPEGYRLSTVQKEIIEGSLLGDGMLTLPKTNASFTETHGLKQYEYIAWKYNELQPLSASLFTYERKSGRKEVVLTTFRDKIFTALEHRWYKRDSAGMYIRNRQGYRVKIVPDDLELTPLTLAVWFFDDGSNKLEKSCLTIATNGFSFEECYKLVGKINELGIDNCKVRNEKGKPLIYIGNSKESPACLQFLEIIKNQIICTCMAYKIRTDHLGKQYACRKANGMCVRCGSRPPLSDKTRCESCLDNEKCRKEILKESGICLDCRSNIAVVGKLRCEECLKKDRARHAKKHT